MPDDHPLACGVLGRSGIPVASIHMGRSDCLLVLGASFSDHTGIATYVPTIQVDFDRMMLGKFHPVDVPLWGELGRTLALLRATVTAASHPAQHASIEKQWSRWRTEKQARAQLTDGRGRMHPAHVFANWTAILGRGLRAWLRSIEVPYALLQSGWNVGAADLILRHLADPGRFASACSRGNPV